MSIGEWMRANLSTQGYCLSDAERRSLWLGLRFSTGACLALVVVALVLESTAMVLVLSGVGLVAALVAGGLLVAACTTVTVTNLCLPSETLAWWERRRTGSQAITT